MADNSLTKLPLGGQLGVSVLVAALIAGAFWYFSYSPMLEEESKKQAQLEQLQRDIRILEATANTNGLGFVTPGALEMSNVDLAQEFTNMITEQRGFQANSRIISTADDMLQELVNLKR